MLTTNTRLASGRYIIQRQLGAGAMAEVYLATDTVKQVDVALKLLRPDLALDPTFEEYFRREARVMQQLQHPNIVRFYEPMRDGELLFLVLDYIDGPNLQKYLFSNKLLPIADALHIAQALATALDYAHASGVIHRDLKPSNVLLAFNGAILLSDFGVARVAGATTTTTGMVGSPAYMAPEQIRGATLTRAADQYSLAVLLWELIASRRPFVGASAGLTGTTLGERVLEEHLSHPPPTGVLPNDLDAPLRKALAKNASDRFPSCTALVQQLEAASSSAPTTAQQWQRKVLATELPPPLPIFAPIPPRTQPLLTALRWFFVSAVGTLATVLAIALLYGRYEALVVENRRTAASAASTVTEATVAANQTETAMLAAISLAPSTLTPTKTTTATVTRTPTQPPTATTRPTNTPTETATLAPKPVIVPVTVAPPVAVQPAPMTLIAQADSACGAQWQDLQICTDPSTASQLFQQAAATGDMYSMRSLGILACGHKVRSENVCDDIAKAQPWFAKSADKGDIDSMRTLGLLVCGHSFLNSYARCLKPKTSVDWLLRAANLGNVNSMHWLGWVYNDYGFKQDACNWWRKAADLGDDISRDIVQSKCR